MSCIYGCSDEREESGDGEKGREISLEGERGEIAWPLVADDLVMCGESEENLRAVVGRFVEVCKRRGLKVNAGKSKVMVLGGEEKLKREVCVNGMRLEHLNTWNVFWTNQVPRRQIVVKRWRVGGGLQVLLTFWLMLGVCILSVLGSCMSHCSCLFFGSETMI